MIKAILFDMDGTLVDSENYYTSKSFDWLKQYKKDADIKDVYKIVGLNMTDTYKTMAKLAGISFEKCKASYDEYFLRHPINYNDYLFSDVKDTLSKLKGKYKLCVCTSSTKEMLDSFIKDCDLDIFDLTLSSDDVINSKPNPEVYLKALDRLNIKGEEAIVVEDSSSGILAGKNAGIYTLARNGDRYLIDQSRADYIFLDMHEILEILDEKNN